MRRWIYTCSLLLLTIRDFYIVLALYYQRVCYIALHYILLPRRTVSGQSGRIPQEDLWKQWYGPG
ncbi:hypothetical protein BDV35DRAFT_367772 [Aspergillus flavus]|uniref:Uncharacterized protein n=1 Tax=Aspergillus flavus TaxID=5059 RepID=A0A5N6GHZ3_ASPFL|nr:hypothetical protein BDV35DRAFT_367772 [Aspergillus flavus]